MITDPIADMLTRIRNAQAASLKTVEIPYSDLKYKIAKILEEEKMIKKASRVMPKVLSTLYIQKSQEPALSTPIKKTSQLKTVETNDEKTTQTLNHISSNKIIIELKYNNKTPFIRGLKRVSKPGVRLYIKAKNIKPIKRGYGFIIISTSKGLMVNKEAWKNKIGGEVLCEIW